VSRVSGHGCGGRASSPRDHGDGDDDDGLRAKPGHVGGQTRAADEEKEERYKGPGRNAVSGARRPQRGKLRLCVCQKEHRATTIEATQTSSSLLVNCTHGYFRVSAC